MSLDAAKQTFIAEATELLEAMEDALLSLEEAPDDADLLHQVFRAMHTIKGTAGVFGYDLVVKFTHTVESVMDDVRSGARPMAPELIAILLDCGDHAAAMVDAVIAAEDPAQIDPDLVASGDALIEQLAGKQAAAGGQLATTESAEPALEKIDGGGMADDAWVISLRFLPDALRNGMDPLSFLRYLRTLGEIVEVFTDTAGLPGKDDYDPESCYLGFRIFYNSDADKQTIEGVFEFAQDDCEITILPPQSRVESYLGLLDELPEEQVELIGEMLQKVGALTAAEVARALRTQAADAAATAEGVRPVTPLGEILVDQNSVQKPVVEQALKKQGKVREKVAQESRFIRVDAGRLGHLIDLVGELVIGSAAMRVMVERHSLDDVEDVVDGVDHLVQEIRDNALQLRMVPIGETFSRFRRVVRDVSRDLAKDIDLVITGGETELDKTVVEKIADPLTHLVRNALDHGIETPEKRLAAGKPAKGRVELNAEHDSGHIVIRIQDDGAGLDPERIRAKAVAKGMLGAEDTPSREGIFRLIFEPGLSTKEQASDLSGRGVGMDVVRRNIEALRGTVELDSEPGVGTTVTIVLPLTLAIIDGFLVGAGEERYVIPLAQVVECVEMDAAAGVERRGQNFIGLRGRVLPYVRLRDFFGIGGAAREGGRESLVVVRFGHTQAGLVVDALHGELQTVIKPLGQVFQQLKGIAGATVLGTGDIALILDVQELTNLVRSGGDSVHQGYRNRGMQ